MRESKVWGLPVAVFTPVLLALLLAAAFRQMQSAAPPAAGGVMSEMVDLPSANSPDPKKDEAPSNEISDFPQLD
jgi:hypothetical protein